MRVRQIALSILIAFGLIAALQRDGAARAAVPSTAAVGTSAAVDSRGRGGTVRLPTGRTVQLPPRSTNPPRMSATEQHHLSAALQRANLPGPPVPVDASAPRLSTQPTVPHQTKISPAPSPNGEDNLASNSALVLFRNVALGAAGTDAFTSPIDEPSVSTNGDEVLYTGNWYAAVSANGGGSFTYLDPYADFPASYGGFCCDQVTIYDPTRNITIWVMQYGTDAYGDNAERIAVADGQAGVLNNVWTYWDVTPQNAGWPTGYWFDYPQVALSSNYLYLTANVFNSSTSSFAATEILRLTLDTLATGGGLSFSYFDNTSLSGFSPVSGATTTLYFASHASTSMLAVFAWPESTDWTGITVSDVPHSAFVYGAAGSMLCTSPDSTNACGYGDSRVKGGWVAGGVIGFAWDAAQGSGGLGYFPYPYVHVARINQSTMTLLDEPVIWSSANAWVYPGISADGRGGVGVSLAYAGGGYYPGSTVLVRDDLSPTTWQALAVRSGTSGPISDRWGDFLTVRPASGSGNTWVGTSFSLQGSCGISDYTCANVEPRFLWFGRQRDNPLPYPNDPLLAINTPTAGATVSGTVLATGWAIDRNATSGTGVDFADLYLDGVAGTGTFLGFATYGLSRPDVAAQYGSQFTYSGWSYAWDTSTLPPGSHTLDVYARSAVTDQWTLVTVSVVTTSPSPTPTPSASDTPAPTPTASNTPTATPTPYRIYLPVVVDGQ